MACVTGDVSRHRGWIEEKGPRGRVPDVGSLSLADVLPKSLPGPAQNRNCCRQWPCSAPTVHQIWLGCPSDIAIRYSNADVNRAASLTISHLTAPTPPPAYTPVSVTLLYRQPRSSCTPSQYPSLKPPFPQSITQATLPQAPPPNHSSYPSPSSLPPIPNPTHLLRRYLGIYLLRRFAISPSHQRLTWTFHARNTCTSALSHRVATPTEFPELPKIRNMYR